MLKKVTLKSEKEFYYDLGEKIIARFPTPSNLQSSGADNSLYLGMKSNDETQKIICKLFDINDIIDFSGKKIKFNSSTGSFYINTNINNDGQVQICVGKNEMNKFYGEYPVDNELVVIDFNRKEAYRESLKNLYIKHNSYKNEFKDWMLLQTNRFKQKANGKNSESPDKYIKALQKVNDIFGTSISKDILTTKSIDELEDVVQPVITQQNYKEINKHRDYVFSSAYKAYKEFLEYENAFDDDETKFDIEKYDSYDFLDSVFIDQNELLKLQNLLLYKKNIVLKGAPGVGKTFIAKKLAYSILGEKNNNNIEVVQFHQNYSYEDFVMGYKPKEGIFELEKGLFYCFCKKAENDINNKYFFIIDEINRGNLSKIFGELLMLIENDKRGKENCIRLAYSNNEGEDRFYIPENVYIIGTMNTADRSLTRVDYALRRRFCFYNVEPAYKNDKFIKYIDKIGNYKLDKVIEVIIEINNRIGNDISLGEGYKIGHSYFCGLELINEQNKINERIEAIVNYEILPLLEEYWFDDKQELDDEIKKLKEAIR